jgi:phosphatidylglycerol:prolipoprotein diacylglycerol transferase
MRPVLFELGPIEVKSYGVFVALAFVGAWLVLRHELGRRTDRPDAASSLILGAALGGLLGARLYWYVEHSGSAHPGDLLSAAGFTWYGGVVGGAAAVLVTARWQRLALADVLGAAAPALALGYALGRIACQFAGDGTYGATSDLPWAMAYPHGEVPTTERVHPTPVYETLAGLFIFWALWRLRHRLSGPRLFGVYLVLAGVERFLVEFIRRNDEVMAGLTQPQLWAAAMALGGIALLVGDRRGAPAGDRAAPTVA